MYLLKAKLGFIFCIIKWVGQININLFESTPFCQNKFYKTTAYIAHEQF